jgi:fructan beta-fructosidase
MNTFFLHSFAIILVMALSNLSLIAAEDILINDFENGYGNWQAEGDAFGKIPASKSKNETYQIKGFLGDGLASSYRKKSLKPMGTLTSPEFTIERDYINLLIGGSPNKNAAGIRILVDNKEVICIAAVKGYTLNETSIPVKQYIGKKAKLQIYDKSPGYWGLIMVDHITQSNTKIGFEAVQKKMTITDKLLIFPVAKSGAARRITINVEGIMVHTLTASLAMNEEDVAWWGYLDMSDMIGKSATIQLNEKVGGSLRKMITCANEPRLLQSESEEKYRPQFHFSQTQGWNNDPNGMVYYNGRHHLFWQCNPLGTGWGNMYWGHASSSDLVNWTEHKRALRSGNGKGVPLDKRHPAMATGACFSGSGNIDHNNALGLNTADKKTLLLFNSDMNAGISVFYSHDGLNFQRWMKKYPLGISGRDAKVIYHEPTQKWIAVSCLANKELGRHYPIFSSKNLQDWTLEQNFTNVHECPEFLELPVDGDKNNKKWVLMEASSEYFIGEYDGKIFIPDVNEKQTTITPGSCYAGQCFSNSPDGRAVYMGWVGSVTKNASFNQGFTIPMELSLRTIENDKIHLYANPVNEINKLRNKIEVEKSVIELSNKTKTFHQSLVGDLYDICLTIEKKGSPKNFTLKVQNMEMTYDFESQSFDGQYVPMKEGSINLRILVDRPTMEVFMADGYRYKLHKRNDLSGTSLSKITFSAETSGTDKVFVKNFKVYPMKSIGENKEK